MDFRKAIILLLIVVLVLGALAGCTIGKDDGDDIPLVDMVEKLVDGVEVPMYETVPLDKDTFEFFAFIPYEDGLSGVQADALVNITPHSLVVVHDENGACVDLAKKVLDNADSRKWLCVQADTVMVANTDHYIVLVMSDSDTAGAIMDNFEKLAGELKDGEYHEYSKQ